MLITRDDLIYWARESARAAYDLDTRTATPAPAEWTELERTEYDAEVAWLQGHAL